VIDLDAPVFREEEEAEVLADPLAFPPFPLDPDNPFHGGFL
jgi:hypothetical protein